MSGSNHIGGLDGATAAHQFWAEQLGGRPISLMEIGARPVSWPRPRRRSPRACARVAVLFYGKAGSRSDRGGRPDLDRAPRVPEWTFPVHGAYMIPFYALWAQRYMHEFKVTSEDLAQVAVFDRYHATLNPDSVMGRRGEITVDDVLNSRYDRRAPAPSRLLTRQRRRLRRRDDHGRAGPGLPQASRSTCSGGAEAVYTDFYVSFSDAWFPEAGKSIRKAADRAFGLAGVSRDDVDVVGQSTTASP